MADQVNLTGSLASGMTLSVTASPPSRPASEKASTAPKSESQSSRLESQGPSGATASPERALEQINSHLQQSATDLKIQVDKATGRTIFKVVDQNTGKVVIQVPSEEVLALARNLRSLDPKLGASGVLMDKQG